MSTPQSTVKQDDIIFHFANENEVSELPGTVLLRSGFGAVFQ